MAGIEKRKGRDGETAFRVKVRLRGFPVQSASFSRLTDAKKWASQTETAIRDGRYFKHSESRKHTLADLIDRYVKDLLAHRPKTLKNSKVQLQWWKDRIGHMVLADVTPAVISEQRDFLLNEEKKRPEQKTLVKRSPATVNRYLAALSHPFTLAMNEWQWVESNPLRRVKKQKEPRGRVRFLSEDERKRLLDASKTNTHPFLYPIVVLALSTGARRSEVLGIRWRDVDFQRGRVIIHETKNGERRALPLVGHALDILKEHSKVRRLESDYVFPSQDATKSFDIRAAWEIALKKANIPDFRFHDLRHSAASYLAMNGASVAEIAEVLGHKTLQMVKRYAHLSEVHTKTVVTRMNEKIFG